MTGRKDTSREDMAWAVRLANKNFDEKMIFRALSAKPSGRREPGSLKYQSILERRGKDAADRYARRTSQKAVEFVQANPMIRDRTAGLVRLLELESAANTLPWAVYAGPAMRRALEAAFVVAERVGSVKIGLAIREHAEIAGQGFDQVRAYREVLMDLGWMRRNSSDRPGRTSRFTLRLPSHIHSHQEVGMWGTRGASVGRSTDREWLGHDAFRDGGLGDAAWYILALTVVPATLQELGFRSGFGDESLEEIVAVLERSELVRVDDEGAVSRNPDLHERLDVVAEERGTAGSAEVDHERYCRDREAFRERQDVNVGAGAL